MARFFWLRFAAKAILKKTRESLAPETNARRFHGQTAVEYLLLIALGIAVVVIGVAIAAQLKGFSDAVMTRTGIERNATIAMLVR